MGTLRGFSIICAVGGMMLTAPRALAQTDEQRADARSAAEQGAQAYDGGKYAEAIDLFTRAESLVHAPPHLLFIARSHAKLGQLVQARESYKKIVRDNIADNAPSAFKSAQADARTELAQLEPRVPSLKIVVKGGEGKNVKVTIDGKEIPPAMIGVAKPIDPGKHQVAATADGMTSEPKNLEIAEAARENVELELTAGGPAAAGAPAPGETTGPTTPTSPTEDTGTSPSNGLRIGSYVALGVGVLGLGAGTLFALQSSSKRKDADSQCDGSQCPVAKKDEIDGLYKDAKSAQTLATIGFVIGGVGVATGVTLFILSGKKSEKTGRVEPWVGVGSAGVRGSF